MLKERKILQNENYENKYIEKGTIDYYKFEGYYDTLYSTILDKDCKNQISEEDYFFTEFSSITSDSDYHTYSVQYDFKGVYLAFNLNTIETVKYFGCDLSNELFNNDELVNEVVNILKKYNLFKTSSDENNIEVSDKGFLKVIILDKALDKNVLECSNKILEYIRNYYSEKNVHITRMFGSYVLLKNENGSLKAVRATEIPIKYCPLMVKLLKEVGGEYAEILINTLETNNKELQEKAMCNLINEVVIKGGYFDTNRPLNSCEANVLFGASETMSSAFKNNLIDAAVIVSNNLGTIITTNSSNTQGAVKRMTGLFYTSPSLKLVNTAINSNIIPVFPYTASIDQLEGVKKAISLGYKNIAVSVAAGDNYLHKELNDLEKDGIKIYKFGLCSTGISKETSEIMKEYADVIWTCASKYVTEIVEPNAIAQVGIKIPVHIMTKKGWEIVKNHLKEINEKLNIENIELENGDKKPVFLNSSDGVKVLQKKYIKKCTDCPYPCV